MAQTIVAFPQSGYKVEISSDGATWKDISGVGANVEVAGGEQQVGEQMTALGEYAIVTAGNKIAPYDITIRSVYTEDANEAFVVAYTVFEGSDKQIYARWSPAGGSAGKFQFTTSITGGAAAKVPIVSCTPPNQDANEGAPALFALVLKSPALYKATISA